MALLVIGLVISVFPVAVSCEPPEVEGWTLTVDGGPIAGNPDLVEYVWNTSRPPDGLYDKIAVRRVVRADGEAGEGAVFILPGTWSSGEQLVHVRKDGIQYGIPDADKSIVLYLAKRGFDVYTLDYRTHFVPHTVSDHAFMLNWGWDAWMGDMKASVDLMKTVSGVDKIYIAGESFGGGAAMNYASVYWEEDLKGIILLDAFWCKSAGKLGLETNSYNLTEAIEDLIASGEYSLPSAGGPNNPIWAYALAHPEDTFLRDFLMDQLYLTRSANPYGYPWSQPDPMFAVLACFDPYWPARLGNESLAYMDWIDCLYLSYDFDDHYIEIDVPVIAFLSERFGYYYWEEFVNGIANPDFTGILLEGYGHLDVYAGTYVRKDVNEPTYQWLIMQPRALLTVISSPTFGVMFTIDGVPQTTPYTEWLPEGSYTLEMPEIHTVGDARYHWNQWSNGNTSRSRTVIMNTDITLTAYYTGPYYQLSIASSSITGIPFTINGAPQTTPYTEWLLEGSYTLEMPETHNGYVWSHWLEDGDTNRIKTILLQGTTWTAVYEPAPKPVGGKATPINIQMNKPETPALWIWLSTIILSLIVTVVYVKKRKRNTMIVS
jgi:pimeloyl-ACP methyl ester carboxylesterase